MMGEEDSRAGLRHEVTMELMTQQQADRDAHMVQAQREELVERIARAISADGAVEPLRGLRLNRVSSATEPLHGVYRPSLCVIAQGSKEVLLGESRLRYDPAHYLIATIELPTVSQCAGHRHLTAEP
jgi:hypothetical protein